MLSDTAIARIGQGLHAATLPPAEWTHEAHFAAVVWLLRVMPGEAAPARLRALICRYNVANGTANTDTAGYHETITLASLAVARAAHEDASPETPMSDVLMGLLNGPCGRSDWLLVYWSRPCLFSVAARRMWVAADLRSFPAPRSNVP